MDDPRDPDQFTKNLIDRLVIDLGIWIHPSIYSVIPVLAPFVIRDSTCRKKNPSTQKDEWGCADDRGYMRDDNSIIKAIPKALTISSPFALFHDSKPGTGYVACHVWRELIGNSTIACRCPKTNSFIPNLVWLPKQIASLTDRQGSYAQQLIEKISYQIYRNFQISNTCKVDVDSIWNMLSCPDINLGIDFNTDKLNYFVPDAKWIPRRRKSLDAEINAILTVLNQMPNQLKIKSSSYTSSLPLVAKTLSQKDKQDLIDWLSSNI